jgi:hypothetical protein
MVSDPGALDVWVAELDSNSFLDGLWLPLEFPRQIISPILASIAVVHLELEWRPRGLCSSYEVSTVRSAVIDGMKKYAAAVSTTN